MGGSGPQPRRLDPGWVAARVQGKVETAKNQGHFELKNKTPAWVWAYFYRSNAALDGRQFEVASLAFTC